MYLLKFAKQFLNENLANIIDHQLKRNFLTIYLTKLNQKDLIEISQ